MGFFEMIHFTLRDGFDSYVEMKITEKKFPHLQRLPEKQPLWSEKGWKLNPGMSKNKIEKTRSSLPPQQWNKVELGMSEEKIGELLGRPTIASTQEQEARKYHDEINGSWDERWRYSWNGGPNQVFFKDKKVVGFTYLGDNGYCIDKGILTGM
jgi:hypothetical protein